jgi:hypothetical protein
MRLVVRCVLALSLLTYVASAFAAVTVSVNGSNHTIPQTNEKGWGTNVTAWIQAISANTLQPSGGTFTLTAEVNTGATYGFKVPYIKTATAVPSTAGVVRLSNLDSMGWRNYANGGNLLLTVNSSDLLLFNGSLVAMNGDLTAHIADTTTHGTTGDIVGTTDSQTLSNKTLTAPIISTISNTGTLTLPTITTTLVGIGTTNTLTAKTLHQPDGALATPSITFENDQNTGIYRAGTDTLSIVAGAYEGLQVKKSTGNFSNVGMGVSASTSDQIPLAIERTNSSAGTYMYVSNTSTSANAYGGVRVIGDSGNVIGAFNAYTDASTIDAFDARVAVRTDGTAKGIVLLAAATAPNDIKFYQGGGATTDLTFQFNDDNSLQVMQQIATPATPSSNSIKIYQKAGDELYTLNDAGTEEQILAAPIAAKGDLFIGTTANTLGVKTVGADNTFLKADSTQAGGVTWAAPSSAGLAVVSKTTTYTATTSDDVILASTAGGAYSITLYAASGNSGKVLRIKKTTNDFTVLTIDGNSSETIDGAVTTTLNTQYEEVTLVCDGTNWHILSRTYPQTWTTYTPTWVGFGSPSLNQVSWKRVGGGIAVKFVMTSGTATATEARLPLPDSSLSCVIPVATREVIGTWYFSQNTVSTGTVMCANGAAYMTLGYAAAGSGATSPQDGAGLLTSGNSMGGFAPHIPITGWN